ncbi:MAG: HIT family protein [Methanobacteriaceae archaeon]|nr:HIT family protein [Methanobacteriaceae archaeon]
MKNYNYGSLIQENRFWTIFLAPNQSNIGTCVIALRRNSSELSDLKDEEWAEFSFIVKNMEQSLKKSFNATLFNWGCLMNSSYLKESPDPHIHWHFIPRYKNPVEFEDQIFDDPYFGYMHPRPEKKVSSLTRKKIIEMILKNMK